MPTRLGLQDPGAREALEARFGIQSPEGWYGTTKLREAIIVLFGKAAVDSLNDPNCTAGITLLKRLYPNHTWQEWKFKGYLPHGWFLQGENLRRWFDWALPQIIPEARPDHLELWYGIRRKQIVQLKGGEILLWYHQSLSNALALAFPDHSWDRDRFSVGHFNKKLLAMEVRNALRISSPEQWYQVSYNQFRQMPAALWSSVKTHLSGSTYLVARLAEVPNHPWEEWRFAKAPKSFWKSPVSCRRYLSSIARRLKFDPDELENWYSVAPQQIFEYNGRKVLQDYQGKPALLFPALFPTHSWDAAKFLVRPRRTAQGTIRQVMDAIAVELGLVPVSGIANLDLEKWYRVTSSKFRSAGSYSLLAQFSSLNECLKAAYPDHHWYEFKFASVPRGFWRRKENRVACLDHLAEQLGVRTPEDWHAVSKKTLPKYTAGLLREFNGSLLEALRDADPTHVAPFQTLNAAELRPETQS